MKEGIFFQLIADELKINLIQVKNTIELLDADSTVPFISRYRKEKTGNLDEEQIREIQDRVQYLRVLYARKQTILKTIKEQGKLTPDLEDKINRTIKLQELEDLYLPYKPKKRTKATIAKEKGLESLAQIILAQELIEGDLKNIAFAYVDPDKGVNDTGEALAGARDVIAEIISENADIRKKIRQFTFDTGLITSSVKSNDASREYEMYFDYNEPIRTIPPHRILAINRGDKEGSLKVGISIDIDEVYKIISNEYIVNPHSIFFDELNIAVKDSYLRLIAPSIQREVRSEIRENADGHAIEVFSLNLRNLLMQSPVTNKILMGIDPGFRSGCKVAVIDKIGKYIEGTTIYPHPPQKEYFESKTTVRDLVEKYDVEIIAIGNGTAGRETESMVAELVNELKSERELVYIIVNEAGASVYSASKVAKDEFPDLEASMRGNISIARRLQDPLAELVKIDPKSIGVGLYQHDVNQKSLTSALQDVVESCVNQVGVDLNTASISLLQYISGITAKSASNIVAYREKIGPFKNREELKKIDGIGDVAFQQAAGFLRILNTDNPLDATSIHPESYIATWKLLKKFTISDINQGGRQLQSKIKNEKINLEIIAKEIECGVLTLEDILKDLEKPGRDPREEMPKPIFKSDVLKMEDLREDMILKGTVRNVVDFGAFVDIGVKQDGLVHISEMTNKFIKSPHEVVGVGDIIEVKVISIDLNRQRVALSMKVNSDVNNENRS